MGIELDKEMAMYQYALFCVTRLVDEYKNNLYPEVAMGLGSFREDSQHYFPVCQEVQGDLCWAERQLSNQTISKESDTRAKAALTDLALHFMKLARKKNMASQNGDDLTHNARDNSRLSKVSNSWVSNSSEELLLRSSDLEKFYDDCLKVIMSDLEKKEIWQMSTLFNNKVRYNLFALVLSPHRYILGPTGLDRFLLDQNRVCAMHWELSRNG